MAPQTTDAPHYDSVIEYGHDSTIPQTLVAPFLDSAFGFGPTVTIGTLVAGLVVRAGSSDTDSFDRSFRDELTGAGSFSLSLANDDANMPDFDDVLLFNIDGVTRFAGVVEGMDRSTYDQSEGAGEVTKIMGSGRLAVTRKSVIAPSRGWDAAPVEVTRSQSWVSVDFDDSGWKSAIRIRNADTLRPFAPGRAIPDWWPDKTAWWVAPNYPGVTTVSAPVGRSLYRSTPITTTDSTIAILSGFNNLGTLYWNGAQIADVENSPGDGNRVDIVVTAGSDNVLAASVTNYIRDTGLIASIYTVDDDGLLDDLIWTSDSSNVLSLGYPTSTPGFTAGEAIRILLEEAQADGELTDVTLDFSDDQDSDGNAWSEVVEITTDVGRKFLEYLESLSDWLIDVQMAPGANVLRAWNWGTRGGTPGVTIAATTDPNTSEVESLSFSGRQIRANRLRIRYKHGYTEVDESGVDPTVTDFLDLSDVESESAAELIGSRELALRKDPSYAGTLNLLPVSSKPYATFDNGDTISHPADPNGSTSSRTRSIACVEDENGVLSWVVELHDIRLETEERQDNWLKRSQMGALAGGSRVTSRRGDSLAAAVKVAAKDCAEFSFQEPTAGAITGKRPATVTGNLTEIYVEVSTASDIATSSSTDVEVWMDGASLGTVTIPAGETSGQLDLVATKVYRNVDTFRAEVVTVGGNVNGVDVQVRAI